ncbi:hypothetical protein [Marinobacter salarius]|uniref:hypothetical protein n=1 Tax=Marinobacter salarius TaxID=1420917 RepID=UPI003BA92285
MEYNIPKPKPGWEVLSGVGNSKLIRSLSIWFFVIPILAKFTESMPEIIDLGIFQPTMKVQWSLPFSLQVLYLATLFFTAANILYLVFSPKIIKDYKSFSEFKEKEGSFEAIKQMFEPLLNRSSEEYQAILLQNFFSHVKTDQTFPVNEKRFRVKFDACNVISAHHSEAFSNIKGAYNVERPLVQVTILVFYILGFSCLGWLVVENIKYVF